ncbi:MAG TPA: hypothetical protein VJP89_21300 [Pyrinomonadaceae bacterium]|nr:hypothetical protein [Pyrinomonadaceae bacterium]
MAADEKQQMNDDLTKIAGDLPDEVKVNARSGCPICDIPAVEIDDDDDEGPDQDAELPDVDNQDDDGDDDFHGCDDCIQDIDDATDAEEAVEVIADVAEVTVDFLAAILDENDELVDSKRFVQKFTRAVRRIKTNPSVQDLLETRRRTIKKV